MSESSQLAVVMAAEREGAQTEAPPAEASDAGQTRVRRLIELVEQDEAAKSSEQIIFTAVLTDQTDSDAAVTDFSGTARRSGRPRDGIGAIQRNLLRRDIFSADRNGCSGGGNVEAVYPDRSYAPGRRKACPSPA